MTARDREFLDQQLKAISETQQLWTNERKPERERMIVRAFLRCIGAEFLSEEVESPEKDPPDVVFRATAFEVTEDLGGRKRGDEWRARNERFGKAKTIADTMEPYTPSQPVSADDAYQLAIDALGRKAIRYGASGCSRLDGLVYLNHGGKHLWPTEAISASDFAAALSKQGWRSASLLFPPYGIVLSASRQAPAFIKAALGKTLNEWPNPTGDGLFG
jgi:hypothetical protein